MEWGGELWEGGRGEGLGKRGSAWWWRKWKSNARKVGGGRGRGEDVCMGRKGKGEHGKEWKMVEEHTHEGSAWRREMGGGREEGGREARVEGVVVVAPRWWMGGQPLPIYIYILKLWAKWVFCQQNGWEVLGSNPLPSIWISGQVLNFLGKGEGGGLGFKSQGFLVTCPCLQSSSNSFII
jgi:hypothetical protein